MCSEMPGEMTAYYNELDPYAAQWLRNLVSAANITAGHVDERSIADVRADDLVGYRRCHFFAGIGVWDYALRLAGWPDDAFVSAYLSYKHERDMRGIRNGL